MDRLALVAVGQWDSVFRRAASRGEAVAGCRVGEADSNPGNRGSVEAG